MQQSFGRLMAVHPESVRAREMQAQSLLGQGRADLAEPRFRSLLQAQADLPGIHLALAKILTGRGDLEGAEKELRAEAVRTPGNSEAAWRLGAVLLKKGDSKAAVAELERSDKLKPDMLETLNDLGTAYQLEGQLEAAEKTFERMIAIDDASDLAASAHLHLSQICRKLGKNAEAAVHLKRFRELEPRGGRPEQ
jgi:tetratricopeptide (TPR) repeat protein